MDKVIVVAAIVVVGAVVGVCNHHVVKSQWNKLRHKTTQDIDKDLTNWKSRSSISR
jgi:hypothetical protein